MLQHDRQLKLIAKSLEKSIRNELKKLQKNDREKYGKFFDAFGTQLKYGIYESFGANKENLQDLLMFKSSFSKEYTTLEEYVSRMKEDQKYIYFASGSSIARIEALPQTEMVRDKGYEILYFTDHVDEFTMQMMHDYNGKEFKSVSADDLGLETEAEKEEIKKAEEDNKALFDFMTEKLGGKVKAVKLSQRLKTHPVCVTSEGALSVEMEKVLSAMPDEQLTPQRLRRYWRSTLPTRYSRSSRSSTPRTRRIPLPSTRISCILRRCSSRVCRSRIR